MMELHSFIERAIGVPFVVGGREWSGWDCWGLVYVAYRDVFGIEISRLDHEYDETASYEELQRVVTRERVEWNDVSRPDIGDISLFRVSKFETHVALVVGWGQMIHTIKSVGTICDRTNSIAWAKRHVGYLRHERRYSTGG